MKVLILCGGQGTRIRDVNESLPKPMLPIGNRPILWHIMKIYSSFGLNDFVLLLGHKSQIIRDYFLNYTQYTSDITINLNSPWPHDITVHQKVGEPWRITFVDTGENSMTGARLWRAQEHLKTEKNFCLTYGDGVGNVDINELIKFHKSHGKTATVTGVGAPGRFGELRTEGTSVRAFNEKPQVTGGYISGGFFVFKTNIFEKFLNPRPDLVLEQEPMAALTKAGELKMFRHDGFWQPMDTSREFHYLNQLWESGKAPWLAPKLKELKDEAA